MFCSTPYLPAFSCKKRADGGKEGGDRRSAHLILRTGAAGVAEEHETSRTASGGGKSKQPGSYLMVIYPMAPDANVRRPYA